MSLLKRIFLRIAKFLLLMAVWLFLPGLPPRTTFPYTSFSIPPTRALSGVLKINNHLEGAERFLEGHVYGPEALIARENEIYTGMQSGEIIKITPDNITFVARIGQACADSSEEALCGRPLGLVFDTINVNNLIVADAYYGIWEVELLTGRKKQLVSPQQELPGEKINRPAKIFNGVAVDQHGDVYWTDSSSDFTTQDSVLTAFANPSGRLFKYERSTNESTVLLDQIFIANGLVISPNEDFIVVSELGANRLLKYHLKGAKAGQAETFVDGLPGHSDNLTPDAEGIWVPLVIAADNENPSAFSMLAEYPLIRLFLARLITFIELPFRLINAVLPNKFSQRIIHIIGHGKSVMFLSPKRATILRVDWQGNIVGSWHGFDGSVGVVSHVLELDDHLILGSPINRFLARVKLPSKEPTSLQEEIPSDTKLLKEEEVNILNKQDEHIEL